MQPQDASQEERSEISPGTPDQGPGRWKWYMIAVGAVGAASLFNLGVRSWLDPRIFPPFLVAVLFCSRFGGAGPGLVATALSSLAGFVLLFARAAEPLPLAVIAERVTMYALVELLLVYLMESRVTTLTALRQIENRYRLVVETMLHGVVHQDASGKILAMNPAAERILGSTPSGYLVRTLVDVQQYTIREDGTPFPGFEHPSMVALRTGQPVSHVVMGVINPREGFRRWINVSAVPVFLPGETRPHEVYVVFEDVTSRKEAEEKLRASQAELEAALASMSDAVFITDVDGQFIDFNDAFATFHRFKNKEECFRRFAESLDFLEVFMADGAPAPLKMWAVPRALRGETETNVEYRLRRQDTGESWVGSYSFAPIRDRAGAIVGSVVTARDITELKKTQEEIRTLNASLERRVAERTAELESMLANATIGLAFADQDLRCIRINACLAKFNGLTVAEHLGRAMREINPRVAEMIEPSILEVFRTGGPVTGVEISFVMPGSDGERRSCILGFYPVLDTDGKVMSVGITLIDITEHNQLEESLRLQSEALRVANAELARSSELKDQFLANMSHELRTPLTGILAMSESLREQVYGTLSSAQARALRDIEESGRHLLSLINDILDVARIEAGKVELEPEPFPVEQLCQSVLRLVKDLAHRKRIDVSLSLDPGVALLNADQRRLKQILVNLLSNAVKFTPEGGKVGLELVGDRSSRRVRFTVWDTGIGITAGNLTRLFQPFIQLDPGLSRQYEGTGLGLALVKRLTELHGGSVTVHSRPGEGSRFSVILPWLDPAPDLRGSQEPATRARESTTRHDAADSANRPLILLVEDNAFSARTLQDYLEFKGYRVARAADGESALRLVGKQPPSLILMDIQMPGMDGMDAIRRLRASSTYRDLPIVALTALAMSGDRDRILAGGANAYVSKPVVLKELLLVIESLLRHSPCSDPGTGSS